MSAFEPAVRVVLEHEGSPFVDDPRDAGGPTRFGITLAWAKEHRLDVDGDGDVDVADLMALTADRAAQRYRTEIWEPLGLDRIADQTLATKALDLAVHAGPAAAVACLQRAAAHGGARLTPDGVLGPATVAAVNAQPAADLVVRLALQQAAFYGGCIQRRRENETFRWNWMKRAEWGTPAAGAQAPGGST
jgi:lysozyme family protein